MVLAHLLGTYGRKIADPSQITLLHFDHGWRKESGLEEPALVKILAKQLGVGFLHEKLPHPKEKLSRNLEEDGRLKRQTAYARILEARPKGTVILTAHHEQDAVESLLWRFFRGEFDEFRQGILFHDSGCMRPFLKVLKEEIRDYAQTEGVKYFNDPGNEDPKFYRAWMRTQVFPLLEEHFPHIKKVLARYLTDAPPATINQTHRLLEGVQILTGSPLNRAQRKALHEMTQSLAPGATLSLPGGAQIRRTGDGYLIKNSDPK